MKFTKKIQSIFILLFFIIFSYFYMGDFLKYHNNKQNETRQNSIIGERVSNFTLEKIKELEEISLFATPNKQLLENIIYNINNAKTRIYIEIYMFTNKKIADSIIKAKKRGIDIKVILEKNPYMSPRLNEKIYDLLMGAKIDVVWSNPTNYSLNHSKMMLIDNKIILSTGNLTYSTFTKNKDLFLFIKDKILLKTLEEIFLLDYNGINSGKYDDNIVLSPNYSREKLKTLINGAKNEINLYFPYLQDNELQELIINKSISGTHVNIIVGKDFFEEETKLIESMKNNGIKINYLNKYKLHSKAIIIDNKYVFIGSINFSEYSLDKNREIGVIIKNNKIIKQIKYIFSNN